MEKYLRKCKKGLAFLLAALLLYGGVKDVMLTTAAESGSADEQATVSEGNTDTTLGGEPVNPGEIPSGAPVNPGAGMESNAAAGMGIPGTESNAAAGMGIPDAESNAAAGMGIPGTESNAIGGMAVPGAETGEVALEAYVSDVDLPDNGELFAGYVEQLLYGGMTPDIGLFGNAGETRLEGNEKAVYDALKAAIKEIAAGTRTSTKDIAVEGFSNLKADEVAAVTGKALDYLLMDCPYDFYWYDKTAGMSSGYSHTTDGDVVSITISFAVAQEYQGADANTVDNSKVAAAKAASDKAQEIVDRYKGMSDYEILAAYKDEICGLVEYNHDAADNHPAYGNPWQLIWVFDGDDATKVVCEGYSKAFQYLCDLTVFSGDVRCYTVTGLMTGGTGAGGHMWNIVTIGGQNYIVDVTNCDSGSIGAPDKLFLAGTAGSVAEGYNFVFDSLNRVGFQYDSDQTALLGDAVLTLAVENYRPREIPKLTVSAPSGVQVIFGDTADDSVLNKTGAEAGSAVLEDGTAVDGSFRWADSVKAGGYGEAGIRELAAVFVPQDAETYESAYPVTVSVTVGRRPVSVTAAGLTKVYGEEDPELTYTADGTVEGYPLSGEPGREAGENVGSYSITAGTLTDDNNPNYTITLEGAPRLTITPAQCTPAAVASQTLLQGVGRIDEPVFKGVKGEAVAGTVTYSYDDLTNGTYTQLTDKLKTLAVNTTGEITYSFAPGDANYAGPVTGKITFTVKDIEFVVGTAPATPENSVTLKSAPVYGDVWEDIVTIMGITAQAGSASDSEPGHFTLSAAGMPDAGNDIPFTVLYNGSLNGKEYKDVAVCGGTVNVAKRIITVTAGTCRVSKVYDGTTDAGTAAGSLTVNGILAQDTGVSVTAVPVAFTDPDAGKQTQMTLPLTLGGIGADNYVLEGTDVTVPCVIEPRAITPVIEITGTYTYTGEALIPALTVRNGGQVMAAEEYEVVLSNNVNAGRAAVTVNPRAGSNYTWNPVRDSFVIQKADYSGERAMAASARYGSEGVAELAALLPADCRIGVVTAADSDGILAGTPVLEGTRLIYRLVNDRAKTGKTAVITVPVAESLNYNGFDLTVTVIVSDKLEQTGFALWQTAVGKVYGDADFTATAVNAVPGSSITFASSDPAVAAVDNSGKIHILKAGSTVITANASETADYMAASAVCTLTVAPKALEWDVSGLSAVDKEGTIQNRTASLYGGLKVTGILETDRAEAVYTCPADLLTGIYTDVAAGTQNVVLAWKDAGKTAGLQGTKAGNYSLPSTLPAIVGRINKVTAEAAPIPESTANLKLSITMESGISQVPEAFRGLENLNTPVKLAEMMISNVQTAKAVQDQKVSISRDSIAVYDVSLMVSINGGALQPASGNDFPAAGLTVTLPYPAGTGRDSHDFVVCHLFTEDINGYHAGETEYPEVTKTAEGIRFKVYGLSPVSVGWSAAGTLGNLKETGGNEEEDEDQAESIVSAPAVSAEIISPKTGEQSSAVWPCAAVILPAALAAYMWLRQRHSRIDSGTED